MKRLLLAALCLAAAACAATPDSTPSAPAVAAATGYSQTMISASRYRISYEGSSAMSDKQIQDRALRHAAQVTLDKGNQWFEIASRIDGDNKHSLVIVMGKGESLAGGAKQYDAREMLASLKVS